MNIHLNKLFSGWDKIFILHILLIYFVEAIYCLNSINYPCDILDSSIVLIHYCLGPVTRRIEVKRLVQEKGNPGNEGSTTEVISDVLYRVCYLVELQLPSAQLMNSRLVMQKKKIADAVETCEKRSAAYLCGLYIIVE